jgi:tetratricopeptide (TPR) repeat protein
VPNGEQLLQLVKDVEGVQPRYVTNFHTMITESAIRAMEIRLDRLAGARAKEAVDGYYRAGLLLTPYFYGAFAAYETQDSSLRDVFSKMFAAINLAAEQERFASTFMGIPPSQKALAVAEVPQPEEPPVANPMMDLLRQGETALNANNNDAARAASQRVLAEIDASNGAALYGLALISSKEGDSDQARALFERATKAEKIEPGMKVWAYIYLGRILDLECQRDKALENYREAVKLGDNTRNAQAAARDGISKPYGDACNLRS